MPYLLIAILGFVVGGAFVMFLNDQLKGASHADLLTFMSSVFGALIAIGGAYQLERLREKAERRREVSLLKDGVQNLKNAIFSNTRKQTEPLELTAAEVAKITKAAREILSNFDDARTALAFAKGNSRIPTVAIYLQLTKLEGVLAAEEQQMYRETIFVTEHDDSAYVAAKFVEYWEELREKLRSPLDDMLHSLSSI